MVSFILCLLPALLATSAQAANMICTQCSGTVDSCQAATQTCSVDQAKGGCLTVAEENTLGETLTTLYSKHCLLDYTAGIKSPLTFTLGKGKYLRINTARCNNADKCNSDKLEVPKESTTTNGLQCPTCFALSADTCDSPNTPCTGDETYCIEFTGLRTPVKGSSSDQTKLVAKGCATASAQGIKDGNTLLTSVYQYKFTKVTSKPAQKITNSGSSLALGKFSFALYLPGLTGLLLVKLLS